MKTCKKCGQNKEESEFYKTRSWCKQCEVARISAWRKKYPVTAKANKRRYAVKHRDKMVANSLRYARRHPDRKADIESRRRARMNATTVDTDAAAIRAIYALAASAKAIPCYLCGHKTRRRKRHVDHVDPISKGGAHASSNLAILCQHCNQIKHAKEPNAIGLLL